MRPQPLWINCGKLGDLWKTLILEQHFHFIHKAFFQQPVEKWINFF